MDDPGSLAALRQAVVEAEHTNADIVTFNMDAAADTARVGGWLHVNGLDLPTVLDSDRRWTRALGLQTEQVGVIGGAGLVALVAPTDFLPTR